MWSFFADFMVSLKLRLIILLFLCTCTVLHTYFLLPFPRLWLFTIISRVLLELIDFIIHMYFFRPKFNRHNFFAHFSFDLCLNLLLITIVPLASFPISFHFLFERVAPSVVSFEKKFMWFWSHWPSLNYINLFSLLIICAKAFFWLFICSIWNSLFRYSRKRISLIFWTSIWNFAFLRTWLAFFYLISRLSCSRYCINLHMFIYEWRLLQRCTGRTTFFCHEHMAFNWIIACRNYVYLWLDLLSFIHKYGSWFSLVNRWSWYQIQHLVFFLIIVCKASEVLFKF